MTHAIPAPSLERIRLAYTNFEQMAQVIAEAMGIDPKQHYRLDLQAGVFVLDEGPELVGTSVLEPANGAVSELASEPDPAT